MVRLTQKCCHGACASSRQQRRDVPCAQQAVGVSSAPRHGPGCAQARPAGLCPSSHGERTGWAGSVCRTPDRGVALWTLCVVPGARVLMCSHRYDSRGPWNESQRDSLGGPSVHYCVYPVPDTGSCAYRTEAAEIPHLMEKLHPQCTPPRGLRHDEA